MKDRTAIIIDGVVAGLIGGAVIPLWFFIFDLAHGRPLETPLLLAEILLHRGGHEAVSQAFPLFVIGTYVIQYTVVHFFAFAIIGAIGALLLEAVQHWPALFGLLLIFVIASEILFILIIKLLGPAAVMTVPWWKVIIGNLMATAAMAGYFFARNPSLAHLPRWSSPR